MPVKKKFFEVEIPLLKQKHEITGSSLSELNNKTIKIDMTRQLRGKSMDLVFKINVKDDKATAKVKSLKVMPYFIRRMLRKRVSYVEDSFETESKESKLRIKPFLITRKKVSRAVKKTLRNSARNWIIDYVKDKKDEEIVSGIINNNLQKPLSLKLKKIYPLSLCEIRILEIKEPKKQKEKQEQKKKLEKKDDKEKS